MANLGFAIKARLGFIPSTEKIEATQKALEEEYKRLQEYAVSDELNEFKDLDAIINSTEFISKKKEILALDYKKTDEFKKEEKLIKLKKDKGVINYFKVFESQDYKRFVKIEESDILKELITLNETINSSEHNNNKQELKKLLNNELQKEKEFVVLKKDKELKKYFKYIELSAYKTYLEIDGSEELEKYNEAANENNDEFKALKKDRRFKIYFKFKKSKALTIINRVQNSGKLEKYKELDEYVNSSDFATNKGQLKFENSEEYSKEKKHQEINNSDDIKFWNKYKVSKPYLKFLQAKESGIIEEYTKLEEFVATKEFNTYKNYMLDKDKFSKSDEYKKETRYNELKKSENIKWYTATKDSDKFNSIKKWTLTFEDDFDSGKIDETKWMNSFFWGEMLVKDRYVLAGEKHLYTDNKNAKLNGTTVKLQTKTEKASGKVWHPVYGFDQKDFDYTSGMLSSANSFRQQYGKFEAKIKIDPTYPVYQAFWLKGEAIAPEIDIFRFNMTKKNRMEFINHFDNNAKNSISSDVNASALSSKYYIYTVEWSDNEIKWLINGIELHKTTKNIPTEPMYVLLSSGIKQDPKGESINAEFEIDWVRCYDKAE